MNFRMYLSDLAGWSDLAVLLGDGVLRSGYLGLFVFVLLKVAQGLTMFASRPPTLRTRSGGLKSSTNCASLD